MRDPHHASPSGDQLELVVSILGCDVVIPAPAGKFVHFMGWLPHCTRSEFTADIRMHHSAYIKKGTEWFAWVAREHKIRGLTLDVTRCRFALVELQNESGHFLS